jgi:hypothetical protein
MGPQAQPPENVSDIGSNPSCQGELVKRYSSNADLVLRANVMIGTDIDLENIFVAIQSFNGEFRREVQHPGQICYGSDTQRETVLSCQIRRI